MVIFVSVLCMRKVWFSMKKVKATWEKDEMAFCSHHKVSISGLDVSVSLELPSICNYIPNFSLHERVQSAKTTSASIFFSCLGEVEGKKQGEFPLCECRRNPKLYLFCIQCTFVEIHWGVIFNGE
jgi:hypothetical protein